MPTGFETLTSTSNEKVRFLRALSDAKTRRESGLMRAEGRKLCYEAAHCLPVDTLFCDEERWDDYAELICLCTDKGAKVYPTTRRIIEYVSEARTPQDVVLSAAIPSLPLGDGPIAALDGVQDPGNCGTIIRTCDAAGFAGVVLGPGCADPFSPKGVRATMGSLFRVPLLRVPDLSAFLTERREMGWPILVSALDGEDFYARPRLPERLVLVIGSEGRGVSAEVSACATHRFKLPMVGGAESLNASVAAGVLIYDLFRERHYGT